MSRLHRAMERWATGRQAKELTEFVRSLSLMNEHDLGMLLAIATHIRHQLASTRGWNLLCPAQEVAGDVMIATRLTQVVEDLQRAKKPSDAAAAMVWLHSVRAMYHADGADKLRTITVTMWQELSRGFDWVEQVAAQMQSLIGRPLIIDGYREFPEGLLPSQVKVAHA
ncbi:MAG: hypothetical protein ACJ8IR_05180 [Alphaproteobacteria bacterium]|jgi:hypothetical protein